MAMLASYLFVQIVWKFLYATPHQWPCTSEFWHHNLRASTEPDSQWELPDSQWNFQIPNGTSRFPMELPRFPMELPDSQWNFQIRKNRGGGFWHISPWKLNITPEKWRLEDDNQISPDLGPGKLWKGALVVKLRVFLYVEIVGNKMTPFKNNTWQLLGPLLKVRLLVGYI